MNGPSGSRKKPLTSKITELGVKNSTHAVELLIYSGNFNVNSSKKYQRSKEVHKKV
jgi:hypothetical protein